MIARILGDGGCLTGGLVRDYLIRGEPFRDVDFYFEVEPRWVRGMSAHARRFYFRHSGLNYHCQRIVPGSTTQDISCNLFSYSLERGLFARPSPYVFDYALGFALLLEKKFALLDLRDANLFYKMTARGWGEVYVPKRTGPVTAPAAGPWDQHTPAATARLNALLTQIKA